MRHWTIGTIEDFQPQPTDLFLVLGTEKIPSGQLPGENTATFREAVLRSLEAQTSGDLKGGEWVEGSGLRGWVQKIGEKPGLDADERLRSAISEGFRSASTRKAERIVFLSDAFPTGKLGAILEGWWLSTYRFESWKSKPSTPHPAFHIALATSVVAEGSALLERSARILDATDWVRDQVNLPGSSLTPAVFAGKIEQILSEQGLEWHARGRQELENQGYQGLVTVGKGSDNEPFLGVARYRPENAKPGIHLVLVGKGVTFDTGGISIKPADHMWEMKNDMAGAATVLGALLAIARLGLPLTVSAVVCLAENRPGNGSVLPGDIFRAKNGKSVMVDNTDAEGRLILTDGLWEAGALGATHVVDLATLTGAVVRALGTSIAGVLSNDLDLSESIRGAGLATGEKFWPLPLEDEYRSKLDDAVADMRNAGGAEAGAITAGLFLREFVPEGAKWAHLDIAGTAFTTKPWKYLPEGATAFGVRSLVELAERMSSEGTKSP
jgi:leucyl aminopeptidase